VSDASAARLPAAASAAVAVPATPAVGVRGSPRAAVALDLAQAFGMTLAFWWLATGLVIAAQRDLPTRVLAGVVSGALALLGLALLARSRTDASPAGARQGLAGAGLLWAWVAVSLYAGWLVGPTPRAPAAPPPNLAAAWDAVHALLWHEVGSLLALGLAWALVRAGPNRTGFQALLAFWGTTQLAKLNVFAGVANPGERFLPEWLGFVRWYFGPTRSSPLLPLTVAALACAAVWLARRAARAEDPFARWAGAALACLLALGAVEHVFLAVRWDSPLWDMFLRLRG
jgi:putative photosynthetic complex assembly protein 2